MAFVKLKFQPGFFTESTDYSATGRWIDGNCVRFRSGYPEAIKGWQKALSATFLGKCRDMRWWSALSGDVYVSLGTHLKLYAFDGSYTDITPIRLSGGPLPNNGANNPLSTTSNDVPNNTCLITVFHAGHGAIEGDFVTLSGATTFNGIAAGSLNKEHQIVEVLTASTYTIRVSGNASGFSAGGGTAINYAYQINVGSDSTVFGTGWGAGTYSRGTWGSSADISAEGAKLRLWSAAPYGEDLIAALRDGPIYYWDSSAGQRAVLLSSLAGASDVPTVVKEVVTSAERHAIAFGCNPFGEVTQDPMLIRWSTYEDATMWTPLPTNAAGDLRIPSGSKFITHVQTYQEILIFTDTSLHSLRYVGAPFYYGIDVISSKVSIIAPKAKGIAQDTVFWMGSGQFYSYRGALNVLDCTVLDYVFSNINESQRDKIYCGTNLNENEVTWFYPSAGSDEVDRYVTYNYLDNTWYYGAMARTAWLDRQDIQHPMATDPQGQMFYHELGWNDDSTSPATPIPAYIESGYVEIGEGDKFMFADKFVPDVTFSGSTGSALNCTINVTFTMADWPGSANSSDGTFSGGIVKSSTLNAPVELYTQYINLRMRGRMVKVKYSGGQLDMAWRVGTPRINVRPDGRQ